MTKAELVSKIAEKTGVEKLTTLTVVETMMSEIKESISSNNSVFLRGFGTFKPKKRDEKTYSLHFFMLCRSCRFVSSL